MRRSRWISFLAMASAACAAIVACSLQDGGAADLHGFDAQTTDATFNGEGSADSSPLIDGSIVDAGATFCDLVTNDASFFFCADFDDKLPTHGFTEVVTDSGTIAFGASDASAPNLFESTLSIPTNDNSQNALLTVPFDFPDAGDAGLSYLSIAMDLRVNSISIDGSAPQIPSANAFILFLDPHYALYAPIVGRPNIAPVSEFGTVDLSDAAVSILPIADGGTPLGQWNRIRLLLQIGADGGPPTLSVFVNNVPLASQVVTLSPTALTSRRIQLLLGPSGNGPFTSQIDYDNVVIRSDKF